MKTAEFADSGRIVIHALGPRPPRGLQFGNSAIPQFGNAYCWIWTGCNSLKVTADSAGSTMFLLPVKAAPAVPAPAPAAAPIRAPLPPPARPPTRAPRPAPPPIKPAVRLPLPLAAKPAAAVSTL